MDMTIMRNGAWPAGFRREASTCPESGSGDPFRLGYAMGRSAAKAARCSGCGRYRKIKASCPACGQAFCKTCLATGMRHECGPTPGNNTANNRKTSEV